MDNDAEGSQPASQENSTQDEDEEAGELPQPRPLTRQNTPVPGKGEDPMKNLLEDVQAD